MTTEQPAPLPCPFCGEMLVYKSDHHGSWWAHAAEPGPCHASVDQLMDEQDIAAWNRRAPAPEGRWRPTHRHRKRGSVYQFVDTALIQTDQPLDDGDRVAIYRGEHGDTWARRYEEFGDGRFESLPAAPGATPAAGDAVREALEAALRECVEHLVLERDIEIERAKFEGVDPISAYLDKLDGHISKARAALAAREGR